MKTAIIDLPTPFASLAEWERFAEEMRGMAATHEGAAEALAEAERTIAEKRKAG